MSQFKPKKLNIDAIHGGQKYPEARSAFLPSDANEIIEALYGASVGVAKSTKKAFIITSASSLIDISLKNNQIIFPKNTHIFADNYFDTINKVTYLSIPEYVALVKFGVVVYDTQSKTVFFQDIYNSGENYNYLYLFSLDYTSGEVVTDLSIPHLVNGEKQNGDATDIIVPKTKEIYTVGADYINISTEYSTLTFPTETFFGEYDFPETSTYYFGDSKTGEGKQALAVVLDTEIDIMDEGAIKFINPLDLIEAPNNYKWLFTLYFDGNEFIYCDLDAPYYINGSFAESGSSVEVVQETGESTTAVMSQKASTESFVPLLSAIDGAQSVYVTTPDGTQKAIPINYAGTPSYSMICGKLAGGIVNVGNPQADTNAVNLGYANEHYVPILPAKNDGDRVYMSGPDGTIKQMQIQYGSPISYTLPARGEGGRVVVGTPRDDNDATTKKYVDEPNARTKMLYWSDIQGGEYIVTNGEYCIGFCNADGIGSNIDPTSGQLRYNGTFDEVLLRGEGNRECIEISGNDGGYFPNGAIIKFTDTALVYTYKILKFRELPCPTGAIVLLIEVIY